MLERYTRRFEEDKLRQLFEMANLSTKQTGLDHGTIYIDNRTTTHGPRVKFYRNRAGKDQPSASITINTIPEVKEDSIDLTSLEKSEIFRFVIKNYDWLIKIWESGDTMNIDEWLEGIKKI